MTKLKKLVEYRDRKTQRKKRQDKQPKTELSKLVDYRYRNRSKE